MQCVASMGQAVSTAGAHNSSNAQAGGPWQPAPSKRVSSRSRVKGWAVACGPQDGRLLSEPPGPFILALLQKLTAKERLHLFQANRTCAAQVLQHAHCTQLQLQADKAQGGPEVRFMARHFAVNALLQTSPRQLCVSMPLGWSRLLTGLPLTNMTHLSILGTKLHSGLLQWCGWVQLRQAPNLQKVTVDSDLAELDAKTLSTLNPSGWLPQSVTHCQAQGSPPMRLLTLLSPQINKVSVTQAQLTNDNEGQWHQLVNHERLLECLVLDDGKFTISYCSLTALQVLQELGNRVISLKLQDITITADLAQYTMQLLSRCPNLKALACINVEVLDGALSAQQQVTQLPATLDSLEWKQCHHVYVKYVARLMSGQLKHITATYDGFTKLTLAQRETLHSISLMDPELGTSSVSKAMRKSKLATLRVHGLHIPAASQLRDGRQLFESLQRLQCKPAAAQRLHVPVFALRGHYNSHVVQLCASRITELGGLRLQPAEKRSADGTTSRQLPMPAADMEQLLPYLPSTVTLLWFADIATACKEYWYSFLMGLPEHVETIVFSDTTSSCYINAAVLTSLINGLQLAVTVQVLTAGNSTPPTKQMVQLARSHSKIVTLQWQQDQADLPDEMEVSPCWLWQPPALDISDIATKTQPSSLHKSAQTKAAMVSNEAMSSADAAVSTDKRSITGMTVNMDAHICSDVATNTDV